MLDNARMEISAAYGDIDNDSDPDILISPNGGPAVLFRNEGTANHYLKLEPVGTKSNRNAIGAIPSIKT
jgi:enediyne biosynthesis protein E4